MATDSLANLASASSHTLVPPGRSSLNEARGSTGVSIPSTSFPPLRHTWNRIKNWSEEHYLELQDTLNWPATEAQLDELEYTIGFSLPAAVRDSYLCHDGQELESNQSCQDGIFFGLPLLSLDQIADEWKFWRAVDDDPTSGASQEVAQWQTSCPNGWVRAQYSCRGWIPLISDRVGNYIGVDMTPHPSGGGAAGQVIIFGRDFDTKVVLWRGEGEGGWGRFLQYMAEELESGEFWTLEQTTSDEEDEEDSIGYESYFSGGGSGAGRGGGDRGGEGSAGFRLTGEYKGWPVLEAWAERSMRCWEEVGLPPGQPLIQAQAPSVRLEDADQEQDTYDIGEGSSTGLRRSGEHHVQVDGPEDHPLQGQGARHSSYGGGPPTRRISDQLLPPVASTKASRNKQKQRELVASPNSSQPPSRQGSGPGAAPVRRQAPAPAADLDIPTIDDVRAARAAALAENERSTQVSYSDLGQSVANSMANLTLGRNGTLRGPGNRSNRGSEDLRRSEGLELESRRSHDTGSTRITSGTALRSSHHGRQDSLNGVVVEGEPRRSFNNSPTVLSPRTSTSSASSSRPNFFEAGSNTSPNLMDGSPTTSPRLQSISSFGGGSSEYVASPLSNNSSNYGMTKPLPRAVHSPPPTRGNSIMGVPPQFDEQTA